MNYFLFNTNFHFNSLKKNFSQEILSDSILLINSHRFDKASLEGFDVQELHFFENPVHTYRDVFKLHKFKKKINELKLLMNNVSQKDTLTVFSEQDFLNDVLIEFFYRRKAKIELIEDGIFNAVYLSIKKHHLTLKNALFYISFTLLFLVMKFFFSIRNMALNFVYNVPVMRMKDQMYSKFLMSSEYKSNRSIPEELLAKRSFIAPNPDIKINKGTAAFVNSPHNTDMGKKYFTILKQTIPYIKEKYGFVELHFCFHPRDDEQSKKIIKNMMEPLGFVRFHENKPTGKVLENVRPEYLFSYMSTALLEFAHCAKHTIYIIREFPEIMNPQVSKKMSEYIDSIYIR